MAPGSTQTGRPNQSLFTRFAQKISAAAGKPATFVGAAALIVLWGLSGPFVGFGDTWQLIINTSTTIITFLMVFVIQNSQNRDTAALHIKLDELIARTEGTRRVLLDLEELDDTALEKIRAEYEELARREREGDGGGKEGGGEARPAREPAPKTSRRPTPRKTASEKTASGASTPRKPAS
ncbi:low affinity iron permease family protein [Starkeya koreensis]|uniref:Low affinity iron permease family protein n=1 Tax=Ancylobacter koreensis TaxID=266121 RepID=A0ABT0DI66_9HYPH|nr:low affinity iron permease family protein [Ancylobacter koreensis]MCK0206969.1 low affinity iron permease family protein [Ancylobacter koreensis]